MRTHFKRKRAFMLAALSVVLFAGACHRHTDAHDHGEPDVRGVRLSFNNGAQVVTVLQGQTNVSVNIPTATTVTVSAQWLDINQNVITDITGAEFELRITGRTFARTGPFTGTIGGLTPGTNQITVQLFHITHGHADFTVPLNIVVL